MYACGETNLVRHFPLVDKMTMKHEPSAGPRYGLGIHAICTSEATKSKL